MKYPVSKNGNDKGKVLVYCDGACEPNPGKGACAAVIIEPNGEEHQTVEVAVARTTNNKMEIRAAIIGIKEVRSSAPIVVISDSQYLVHTMTRGWKRKKNQELWDQLDTMCEYRNVSFRWVRGHSGDKYNEMCDVLAEKARGGSMRPRRPIASVKVPMTYEERLTKLEKLVAELQEDINSMRSEDFMRRHNLPNVV